MTFETTPGERAGEILAAALGYLIVLFVALILFSPWR